MSNDTDAQGAPAPEAETPAVVEAAAEANPLQAELDQARDDLLRALAEVENTRRRADRQAAEARAYAIDRFAGDLLGVADTLARALAAAPRETTDDTVRNLITGIEMTERAMLDAFQRHGLKRVGSKGETFDPKVHQAVAQAPAPEAAGTVLEVMQAGYVLGDRTLRAAMVMVSAGPPGGSPGVDIKV